MRLNLGVLDVAYADAHGGGAETTGEVAEILEKKYHVMESFFETRRDKIGEWLAEAMVDEIERVTRGLPASNNPYAAAESRIEAEFRAFLDADEMSGILPLTQQITAAQMGVNHRKKAGYNKDHKARVAFVDTGLFQSAFRCWVQDYDVGNI